MAPEIMRGLRYKGPQVDVFSLGVTLFLIVVAVVPHDTDWKHHLKNGTTEAFFRKIDPKGKISSEFKELVIRMFAEDGN